jgi:hypothetical protein
VSTSGIDPGNESGEDAGDGMPAAGTACRALLLVLDGITLLSLGVALAVDLGVVPNLAKALFFTVLVLDVLALNVVVLRLLPRP